MAYNFTLSDGITAVSIADNVLDTSQFSIGLLGKNYPNYGGEVAKAFVHMLENFANTSPPPNPTKGQCWYDSTPGVEALNVYDGSTWVKLLSDDSSGNLSVNGDIILSGNLLPDSDCTGGVGADIGEPNLQFCNVYANTFHGDLNGTALQARYADLAEKFHADFDYTPGTLVKIGGENEITATKNENDDVFSVISTKPGVMLNSDFGSEQENKNNYKYVALSGRVPVLVKGPVSKGDKIMPSNEDGVGKKATNNARNVVGIVLEEIPNEETKLILCFVRASV